MDFRSKTHDFIGHFRVFCLVHLDSLQETFFLSVDDVNLWNFIVLDLLFDLLKADELALHESFLFFDRLEFSLVLGSGSRHLNVKLLDLKSMLLDDLTVQTLECSDFSFVLQSEFVIFFIDDFLYLLGDNLLLLVVNILDLFGSFLMLTFEEGILRFKAFSGLLELLLLLLHLEVKFLDLDRMHSLKFYEFLFVLTFDFSTVVDLLGLLNMRHLLLHRHLILNVSLLKPLHL